LGKLKLINPHHAHSFDLTTDQGRKDFSNLSRNLADVEGLQSFEPGIFDTQSRFVTATLKLTPNGFWRIGQGDTSHCKDGSGKPADLLPKTEQRVKWKKGHGKPAALALLVPASSLKGALAHRVAFHANRLAAYWAGPDKPAQYDKSEQCEAVQRLFGHARDDRPAQTGQDPGQAGRVWLDDAYVAYDPGKDLKLMTHNAIDRFSGGVREHFLFSEELVWNKPVTVELLVDTDGLDGPPRDALRLALDDLCRGRLSLGGGAGKGHGFFQGEIAWSDQGRWINGNTGEAA
jgi:CRISPR/Cas system CSM-associated protein Csm3 (group 7 of RAMP superfamily)